MNAAWWDNLEFVKEFRELIDILRDGPNKADLLRTQELMQWLFWSIAFLGFAILMLRKR